MIVWPGLKTWLEGAFITSESDPVSKLTRWWVPMYLALSTRAESAFVPSPSTTPSWRMTITAGPEPDG